MSTTIKIETLLPWTEPKLVETRVGTKNLRKAIPTEAFWSIWRTNKEALKAAGLGCSRNNNTGEWEVCWWQSLDPELDRKRQEDKAKAIEASRAVEAAINVPVPEGRSLRGYQRAGIAFGAECFKRGVGVLIGDEMGLGKTIQAIGLINLHEDIKKVVIVCSNTLKLNWRKELGLWLTRNLRVGVQVAGTPWVGDFCDVVILNYDIVSKYEQQLTATSWDLRILDEAHYCFPAGTMVKTKDGKVPIEKIRKGQSVLSCVLSTGELKYKSVTGTIKTHAYTDLVRVTHEKGQFVCTADHEVFTADKIGDNWKEAGALRCGDYLYYVRDENDKAKERKNDSKILQQQLCVKMEHGETRGEAKTKSIFDKDNHEGLRLVQESVSVSFKGCCSKQPAKILRTQLCCEMENEYGGKKGKIENCDKESPQGNYWKQEAGRFNKNDIGQSNAEAGYKSKNDGFIERKNIPGERWKRTIDRASKKTSEVDWLEHGSGNLNESSRGEVQFASTKLQGRSWKRTIEDSNRGGRKNPHVEEVEVLGQEEDRNIERSRVVSVEVLKQECNGGCGESDSRDRSVYCLEVKGTENFFAEGVLVSNCKNPKAKRTKATLAINARRKVTLTGTPMENRTVELWTLISDLDPVTWNPKKGFWKFGLRYCDGKNNGWGWEFKGNTNSQELQQKLRGSIMVRRLKCDVLTELPPKRRQVIEVETDLVDGADAKAVEEQIERLRAKVELAKASEDRAEYERAVQELSEVGAANFESMASLRVQAGRVIIPHAVTFIQDALEDGKIVVFAHHLEVVNALKAAFPQAAVITGEVKASDRQAEVERFQNDPACNVFIGNGAAAEGITLTAASQWLCVEGDWVPGKLQQKEDRCHRIGQRDSVLCTYLVPANTICAYMMNVNVRKLNAIDETMDRQGEIISIEQSDQAVVDSVQIDETEAKAARAERRQLEIEAAKITPKGIELAHRAMKMLAGSDEDKASQINGIGFSKMDVYIGHSLANAPRLSQKQGVLAARLANKYRRQLGGLAEEIKQEIAV